MKLTLAALALPIAVNAAYSAQEYASGAVHNELMQMKMVGTPSYLSDTMY